MEAHATTRPRILVTLDRSECSESVLPTVTNLAQSLGAEVELFAVGRPESAHDTPSHSTYGEITPQATSTGVPLSVPLPSAGIAPRVETRVQALDRLEAELRHYLQGQAARMAGVNTSITVELDDDPARAIVARARRTRPDLIAMATHGRTGLKHLLAGSVCEAVIRSGVAPVLVIRP